MKIKMFCICFKLIQWVWEGRWRRAGKTELITLRIHGECREGHFTVLFLNMFENFHNKKKKKMPIYTQSIDYRVFLNGGFGYTLESTLMHIKDIWRLLLVEKDGKTKFIEMKIWNVEFKTEVKNLRKILGLKLRLKNRRDEISRSCRRQH